MQNSSSNRGSQYLNWGPGPHIKNPAFKQKHPRWITLTRGCGVMPRRWEDQTLAPTPPKHMTHAQLQPLVTNQAWVRGALPAEPRRWMDAQTSPSLTQPLFIEVSVGWIMLIDEWEKDVWTNRVWLNHETNLSGTTLNHLPNKVQRRALYSLAQKELFSHLRGHSHQTVWESYFITSLHLSNRFGLKAVVEER
jgi:hypothetical protein